MMELRVYQREAVEAVYEHLRSRDDNPCVVIPTGGGKTPVIATMCRDAVLRWSGRVLILAHVKELLEQTAEKLRLIATDVPVGIYSAGLRRRDFGCAQLGDDPLGTVTLPLHRESPAHSGRLNSHNDRISFWGAGQ